MCSMLKKHLLFIFCALCISPHIAFNQDIHSDTISNQLENDLQYLNHGIPLLVQQADSGNLGNVKLLLEFGADPNVTWYGVTPLMYASQAGHYDVTKELILYNADLEMKDSYGNTALHYASMYNNDSIAELLILNGSHAHPVNNQGISPLHYASTYNYTYLAYLLLYYGAHIDSTDNYGNTPLMTAVYSGAANTCEYLLENWADVDKPDNNGFTPLMVAAQFNDTTMLRVLTSYGGNVYARNNNDITALALAIENNCYEAILFLLHEKSAKEELSPNVSYADLAHRKGYHEISAFLQKVGSPLSKRIKVTSITPYLQSSFNSNHFHISGGVETFIEPYGIYFKTDFGATPSYSPIIIQEVNASYQFFEKRYFASIRLGKELYKLRTGKKGLTSILLGVNYQRTWGKYNFTSNVHYAKSYNLLSPELKATYTKRNFYISASIQALALDYLRKQPIVINISTGYAFNLTKPKIKSKQLNWQ